MSDIHTMAVDIQADGVEVEVARQGRAVDRVVMLRQRVIEAKCALYEATTALLDAISESPAEGDESPSGESQS